MLLSCSCAPARPISVYCLALFSLIYDTGDGGVLQADSVDSVSGIAFACAFHKTGPAQVAGASLAHPFAFVCLFVGCATSRGLLLNCLPAGWLAG